jgi:ribosome-binding factor A
MSQRLDRVDELLRQEIGAVLARSVSDPRIGFVTVTKVETTPDLSQARVWVSVIGTPDERKATMRALEHAMPYVRRVLGDRIRIRRIPALHVRHDDTIERGTRVLKLLDDIGSGIAGDPLAADAASAVTESLPTPIPRFPREGDAPPLEPDPSSEALSALETPRARATHRGTSAPKVPRRGDGGGRHDKRRHKPGPVR